MTGEELREHRLKAGIMSWVVGAEMGVSATRITHIETRARVTEEAAQRYLAALARCIEKRRGQVA